MRGFGILVVAVVVTIGASVAAIGLTFHPVVTTVDARETPVPVDLVNVADGVIAMAERHDGAGLLRSLAVGGVYNSPAVLEAQELLKISGEFGKISALLSETRPIHVPAFDGYLWSGGGESWLTDQSKSVPLLAGFGGLQISFGWDQSRWELLGIGVPSAESFPRTGQYGSFLGAWAAHDRFLTVNPDGSVLLSARGFQCPVGQERCQDHFVGDDIIDGENATGRIVTIDGDRATVDITRSTLSSALPLGRASMTYNRSTDSVSIAGHLTVCGPHGPVLVCGV